MGKIFLEIDVDDTWDDYVNGNIHPDLIAEDIFPIECRKDGIISVKTIKI